MTMILNHHDLIKKWKDSFERHRGIYWANLSRTTNLLIILNITLFFATELVTKHGYYYTTYSLYLLLFVQIGLLVPISFYNRLWYYCIFLICEILAIYLLVFSIWFWVATNKV